MFSNKKYNHDIDAYFELLLCDNSLVLNKLVVKLSAPCLFFISGSQANDKCGFFIMIFRTKSSL